jgi:uncharacterized protein
VTPFDEPQAELAWMFLQTFCDGGDIDEGFTLLSDDFTYWSIFTRTSLDKDALRAAVDERRRRVELSLDLSRCLNVGETVVIEGEVSGTTTDGEEYDSPFVCIFDTRDGLIVSMREYSDTRAFAEVIP